MEKGKKLEWLMAVILLSAAYVLSREGARLVAAQKAATKVVVLDSGHGGDDPDRKSTRLNSSHMPKSRMPSSA